MAGFLVGAMVALGATTIGDRLAVDQDTFDLPAIQAADAVQTIPVARRTIDLDDEKVADGSRDRAVGAAESLTTITGKRAERRVESARGAGYHTRSGLRLDWGGAMAQRQGSAIPVSVPLIAGDIPDITKVVFVKQGDQSVVVE